MVAIGCHHLHLQARLDKQITNDRKVGRYDSQDGVLTMQPLYLRLTCPGIRKSFEFLCGFLWTGQSSVDTQSPLCA